MSRYCAQVRACLHGAGACLYEQLGRLSGKNRKGKDARGRMRLGARKNVVGVCFLDLFIYFIYFVFVSPASSTSITVIVCPARGFSFFRKAAPTRVMRERGRGGRKDKLFQYGAFLTIAK